METAPQGGQGGWTIERAERLLHSLKGVVSVRVVARPGGEIDEIHVLTTNEVAAKQTVRNVESALLAHLDLPVDHRKISVAQTKERPKRDDTTELPKVQLHPDPGPGHRRLLFFGHQVETERSHRVKHSVEIEWCDHRFVGEASAADLPRARLEAVAEATLEAVEQALASELGDDPSLSVALALDGVKQVDAFDGKFMMVSVHAIAGREITALTGATAVEESADRATILATLQATDRWVRGRV